LSVRCSTFVNQEHYERNRTRAPTTFSSGVGLERVRCVTEAHVDFRNRFLHLTSLHFLRRLVPGLATRLELTLVTPRPRGRAIATIGPPLATTPDADTVERRDDTVGQMSVAFVSEEPVVHRRSRRKSMNGHCSVERPWRHQRRMAIAASAMTAITAFIAPTVAYGLQAHVAGTSSPYGVGVTRCTFVDRTRNVLDYATSPPSVLAQQRTLVTEIRYPTLSASPDHSEITNAPPAQQAGGYPMIVFAHGYDVTPDTYASLLETWAEKGYVVAAPIFPDESSTEVSQQHVDTEADIYNEPADLAFVTQQLLTDSSTLSAACPLVQGLVRPSELAFAGHSDGADAVGLLAYSTGRDPQGVAYARVRQGLAIRATLIFSGSEDGTAPYRAEPSEPPLLLVQSARDQCNAPNEGLKLYGAISQGDKWFLELRHAHHLPPFDGEDRAAFDVVATTTTSFLQFALSHTLSTSSLHAEGNARPLVGRMTRGGAGPTIAPYLDAPPCGYH